MHGSNINLRTFSADRGFVITAGVIVVGFVSRWKQRKKICVTGIIPKFPRKVIMVIL